MSARTIAAAALLGLALTGCAANGQASYVGTSGNTAFLVQWDGSTGLYEYEDPGITAGDTQVSVRIDGDQVWLTNGPQLGAPITGTLSGGDLVLNVGGVNTNATTVTLRPGTTADFDRLVTSMPSGN